MITREDRGSFEERVRALGADIHFRGGQPALPRIDRDLAISVDRSRLEEPGETCHRVTVSAGLPPPLEVRGLICTVRRADTGALVLRAVTDRRGQVRLTGLEPMEYRLRVEPRPTFLVPQEFLSRVATHLLGKEQEAGERRYSPPRRRASKNREAGEGLFSPPGRRVGKEHEAAERLLLQLGTPDGRYRVALDETVSEPRQLVLRVDVDPDAVEDALLAVKIDDASGRLLARGYVGLRPGLGGRKAGEVLLDPLCLLSAPTPSGVGLLRGLRITLEPSLPEGPGPDDRELLERSLKATTDPRSRAVLDEALRKIPPV